jgi:hypothetical protein
MTSRAVLHPRLLAATAALSVALGALLAATGPAEAAFPGRNGVIAYESKSSPRGVFFVRRANGTGLRRLWAGGPAAGPAFSPQGRRIAFGRFGALWVMNADGTDLRKLTVLPDREAEPAWSPGANAVAFASGRPGGRRIWVVGADGNRLRRVTTAGPDDHSPAWSVRNRIAFVRSSGRHGDDIWVADPRTSDAWRLSRHRFEDRSPAWSPDGRRLAFVRGRPGRADVYVMRRDGSGVRRLTRLKAAVTTPAWSPDGRRIAFSMGRRGARQVYVMRSDGRRLRQLTRGRTDAREPDWGPVPGDPVIAAAGDIACDPASAGFAGGLGARGRCRQRDTSDLMLRMDLAAVLPLGDLQYERGTLDAFMGSFHPTWGRLKSIMRPVVGNHEYRTPDAAGYFDYFNGPGRRSGPAGPRDRGYYSYDLGEWHMVALNSQCAEPRRSPTAEACAAGSAQEQWLRRDLAENPRACTLAYFHHPRFSSASEGASPVLRPVWQALYEAGVDVVLNGHAHVYERFAQQDPAGAPDPVRGIREFVVGTGGKSRPGFGPVFPNSEVRSRSFGVLRMTLRPGGYEWEFVAGPGDPFADAGAGTCH